MFKNLKSYKKNSKTQFFQPWAGLSLSQHVFLVDLCLHPAVNHLSKCDKWAYRPSLLERTSQIAYLTQTSTSLPVNFYSRQYIIM